MTRFTNPFETAQDPKTGKLCEMLNANSTALLDATCWPKQQLQDCANAGVYRWFVPEELGGLGWNAREIVDGYLRLGSSCLTTTFVITQWVAAVRRILSSENKKIRSRLLPDLLSGRSHITVGISHLTTSRRHLSRAVLRAIPNGSGYELDGFSPWVTAGPYADHLLVGASLDDGQEILVVVDTDMPGVQVHPVQSLVALSASQTGKVTFDSVIVPAGNVVHGPRENVLASKDNSGAGGLQTSTLALALSLAAVDFIKRQSLQRPELSDQATSLDEQWHRVLEDLYRLSDGDPVCSTDDLRTRANSIVLRSTQAALVAAKGSGFVEGHPVGRWCREALFFLVWSCPQSVQVANLCELAGIES